MIARVKRIALIGMLRILLAMVVAVFGPPLTVLWASLLLLLGQKGAERALEPLGGWIGDVLEPLSRTLRDLEQAPWPPEAE